MTGFVLSSRSQNRLLDVHPDLKRVVRRAIKLSEIDFMVVEGRRTLKRQQELVRAGASQTLNSRHLTGHAVDLAAVIGRRVRWDWPLYARLNQAMQQAAEEWAVAVEWGGAWTAFPDGPHWQLPWLAYPAAHSSSSP